MRRPARLAVLSLEDRVTPAPFTVSTIADAGAGSLRQAILDANAAAGLDDIVFAIPGTGVQTIQLASQLPLLEGPVAVNGYTQAYSTPNTLSMGSNAVLRIEVLGGGSAFAFAQRPGFIISGSSFRGLSLGDFSSAAISIGTASNVTVAGNFLGVRPDGVTARANGTGVSIEGGSAHVVGGPAAADRNVISGNTGNGVSFGAGGVLVQGNVIGLTAAGTAKLGNGAAGVTFQSSNNTLRNNLIGGNGTIGLWARNSSGTTVVGNWVGVDVTGNTGIGNVQDGIRFTGAATGNVIGGGTDGVRNVVSGNGQYGIAIDQTGSNTIAGNYTGTNAAGTAAIPNQMFGILSDGPATIGGNSPEFGNLVSGNVLGGMQLRNQFTALFNHVGTDLTGAAAIPNKGPGVLIDGAVTGQLGRATAPNHIAFNGGNGVSVQFPATHYRVSGNSIHNNGGLGIELVGDSNDQIAPPSLTTALPSGTAVQVTGTVTGVAGNYTVEVFAGAVGDGEGKALLGTVAVSHPGGTAGFAGVVNASDAGITAITATLTKDSTGSTSEFSSEVLLNTLPNTPPTITPIANQTIAVGGTVGPIAFQVQDAESPATALIVRASTSNGTVVPLSGVILSGSGTDRTVTVSVVPAYSKATTSTLTLVVTDPGGANATTSFTVTVVDPTVPPPPPPPPPPPTPPSDNSHLLGKRRYVIGPDRGSPPDVQLREQDGSIVFTKRVFDSSFTGGVRTAAGDVNGDGVTDMIAGSGPGGPPHVVIVDGKTGETIREYDAFETTFTGGVFVASGDFDGDGYDDIVVSPDQGGGPRVQIRSGKDHRTILDFFGIEDVNFRGGARPAVGDITGDGRVDLVVAAGFGGGPRVCVFDGARLAAEGGRSDQGFPLWNTWKPFGDILLFDPSLRNGAYVTAGDLNGDRFADLLAGGGPGGGPHVKAFSGKDLLDSRQVLLANFFSGDVNSRGGVRLAVKNLDEDAQADLVTTPGEGAGATVRRYLGKNINPGTSPPPQSEEEAFPGFNGGAFVG